MNRLRIWIALTIVLILMAMVLRGRGRAQVGTVIPTSSPIPTAIPTPAPGTVTRTFHCNCTSAGQPVVWAGNVQALSYFQARQLATSQCSAYLGAKPISPLIPTPAAASQGSTGPTFVPLAINACALCACN
jgi:hypothetical protein